MTLPTLICGIGLIAVFNALAARLVEGLLYSHIKAGKRPPGLNYAAALAVFVGTCIVGARAMASLATSGATL
jgi:hypothetical protein